MKKETLLRMESLYPDSAPWLNVTFKKEAFLSFNLLCVQCNYGCVFFKDEDCISELESKGYWEDEEERTITVRFPGKAIWQVDDFLNKISAGIELIIFAEKHPLSNIIHNERGVRQEEAGAVMQSCYNSLNRGSLEKYGLMIFCEYLEDDGLPKIVLKLKDGQEKTVSLIILDCWTAKISVDGTFIERSYLGIDQLHEIITGIASKMNEVKK